MLLVAVHNWKELLVKAHGKLYIHGDAKGVLQAVVRRQAKNPDMNLIVMEIQLELGMTMFDVTAAHFWSEENDVCDSLSRVHEGKMVPNEVANAETWEACRKAWTFVGRSWK